MTIRTSRRLHVLVLTQIIDTIVAALGKRFSREGTFHEATYLVNRFVSKVYRTTALMIRSKL